MLRPDGSFVSVVIRCRNAAADLKLCLQALASQRLPAGLGLEVIVVDNESTDDTASVASSSGATVLHLPTVEFTWGRALNRGIAASRGDFVLLLSADAHPADGRWLAEMLVPFRDDKVAAVYGRQVPRRDAPIDERARLHETFGAVSRIYREGAEAVVVASNSCAAIRRCVWETWPYDEQVIASEDQLWTSLVLCQGYTVCYQAAALAYHSHKDSVGRYVWRQWEFYEKVRKEGGRNVSVASVLWYGALLGRRRARNCLAVPHAPASKFIGLVRLPVEILLFMTIGILCPTGNLRRKVRPLLWG